MGKPGAVMEERATQRQEDAVWEWAEDVCCGPAPVTARVQRLRDMARENAVCEFQFETHPRQEDPAFTLRVALQIWGTKDLEPREWAFIKHLLMRQDRGADLFEMDLVEEYERVVKPLQPGEAIEYGSVAQGLGLIDYDVRPKLS
jgi:hypothetical protein